MDKDLLDERYQGLVYDVSNRYDVEPIFIDYAVSLLAGGYDIKEDNFIKGYFVRLAESIMKEVSIGLKSRRIEIVESSQRNCEEIEPIDLNLLSANERGILTMNVAIMPGDGKVKYGHLSAFNYAKEDIASMKERFATISIEEVILKKLGPELLPLVKAYHQLIKAEAKDNGLKYSYKEDRLVKAKTKPRRFKKKRK